MPGVTGAWFLTNATRDHLTAIDAFGPAAGVLRGTSVALASAQRPITLSALLEPSGAPAWKTLPSWYLLGTKDNILPPALQEYMAERAHSHTVRVPASHLSMLSRPDTVTNIIVAAARGK